MDSLVEVTLMKNRQQATNEIPAITRHLKEQRERSIKNNVFQYSYHIFMKIQFTCVNLPCLKKLGIYPYSIIDFINKLNTSSSLLEMMYTV